MEAISRMTRLSVVFFSILAVIIAILFPSGYFILGYQHQRAVFETEAHMNSMFISEIISANPGYWRYEQFRLVESLTAQSSGRYGEMRRIIDSKGTVVAQTEEKMEAPKITVTHAVYDAGVPVGRVEITGSLRPLLENTFAVGLFSVCLGAVIFLTLKAFPLRALAKAMQSVYEEKEKAQAILNNIPDIAWLKDREDRYIAANGPFCKTCGVDPDKLSGLTDLDLWPRDLAEHYRADDSEVMETGKAKLIEEPIIDTKGKTTWIETIKTPIFNDRGEVIGTTGIARDFTERKQMEEALKEREEKLRAIAQTAQDAVVMIDEDGNISFWNPAAEGIFGYSKSEALGRELHMLLGPQRYHEAYRRGFETFRKTGQGAAVGKTLELGAIRKGGVEFPVELSLSAIQLSDKWNAVGIIRDISERKLMEKDVRELEHKYHYLFENMADAIFLADAKTSVILDTNLRGEQLLGRTRDEIIGMSQSELHPPGKAEEYRKIFADHIKKRHEADYDGEVIRKDGTIVPVSIAAAPSTLAGKHIILGLFRDITERKRAEKEIMQLNTKLEQRVAERTKQLVDAQEELVRNERLSILGQLAGSVGHELRNPLGVMNNAVYYLKAVLPDPDETVSEYLNMIKGEIDNSERIISDLLDFSRTKPPQMQTITVRELIIRSIEKCSVPECVTVISDIPETLPLINIDPFQMCQVFQNLVMNAVQAMPEGGHVRISARKGIRDQRPEVGKEKLIPGPDQDVIEITVADTGQGIAPENIKKLFQPLFTTKAKGIGLGLVVSKRLTEANGGKIEAESQAGKGTTFTVILPAAGIEQ